MSNYCQHCGQALNPGANFCGACAAPIVAARQATTATSTTTALTGPALPTARQQFNGPLGAMLVIALLVGGVFAVHAVSSKSAEMCVEQEKSSQLLNSRPGDYVEADADSYARSVC